jgi:hypothetical protein
MPSKLPTHSQGHEPKVKELILYNRYPKILFYSALFFMAVNALLTYGIIFHQLLGPSPKMCSHSCQLDMYTPTVHENVVIPHLDDSLTRNTAITGHEVESKALEVRDTTKRKNGILIRTVSRYMTNIL